MRKATLYRKLAALAVGGTALQLGGGLASCSQNSDFINFYSDVGAATIDIAAEPARGVSEDFTIIVVDPTVNLLAELWNNFVTRQFPVDTNTNVFVN
jgi:hypothetical protein